MEQSINWNFIGECKDEILATRQLTGETPFSRVMALEGMMREYDKRTGYADCKLDTATWAGRIEPKNRRIKSQDFFTTYQEGSKSLITQGNYHNE